MSGSIFGCHKGVARKALLASYWVEAGVLLIALRRVGQPRNREVSGPRVNRPRWGEP